MKKISQPVALDQVMQGSITFIYMLPSLNLQKHCACTCDASAQKYFFSDIDDEDGMINEGNIPIH